MFYADTTSYKLTVPNSVTSITIEATVADVGRAKNVTGTGIRNLNVGSNICNIVVTAENDSTKTYTITITREAAETDPTDPDPTAPTTYTVTFYLVAGNSYDIQNITAGSKAVEPAVPVRDGYVFAGWYNGEFQWNFSSPVTANTTLTAKWTANGDNPATAVETRHAASLQPYPNPTSGVVYIDNYDGEEAEVYNVLGVLVETKTLHATSLQSNGSATFDISHLPAGVYIIKVGDKAAKVVKE
jgi:uncharacterized repeat protein (TIGR02543 family)